MSAREIIGIVALAGVAVCGLISSLIQIEMVEQVNAMLPEKEQFSPLGWYAPKTIRLFQQYGKLYPGGTLRRKYLSIIAIAVSCLIFVAWAIVFP